MSNVTGRVDEVYSYNTKFGEMFGVVVNGQKYGAGKVRPRASSGDTVSFRYTENGQYKNIDMKTFEASAGATQAGPPSAASIGGGRGETSDGRQNSIVRQNALSSAVAYLGVLAAADAIPGITKTMKSDERYGLINALLAETADEFFTANIKGVALGGGNEVEGAPSRAGTAADKAEGDKNWT
jgi:hypothetical protein